LTAANVELSAAHLVSSMHGDLLNTQEVFAARERLWEGDGRC
jgi:hypothetical protein